MEDVRPYLRERLKQLEEHQDRIRQELATVEMTVSGLRAVIKAEDELWRQLSPTPDLFHQEAQHNNSTGTLPPLLTEFLRERPLTLDQLKQKLDERGYSFGDKSPGRVVNFALVGLLKRNSVNKLDDGRWELKDKGGH
jgi:hypothetical protein